MQVGFYLLVIGALEGLKICHRRPTFLDRLEQRPCRAFHLDVVAG